MLNEIEFKIQIINRIKCSGYENISKLIKFL